MILFEATAASVWDEVSLRLRPEGDLGGMYVEFRCDTGTEFDVSDAGFEPGTPTAAWVELEAAVEDDLRRTSTVMGSCAVKKASTASS